MASAKSNAHKRCSQQYYILRGAASTMKIHFFSPAMRTRATWFVERIRSAETQQVLGFHVQLGWIGWSFYY